MIGLKDVVAAWRTADPARIHPTREHVSEHAYWESGRTQAQFVADLIGGGGDVLDFGCGDGRIAIPLRLLGLNVVAMDSAPEMIERLHHQAQVQGVEGIETAVSDGSRLTTRMFDVVNCRAVLIHHSHNDVAVLVNKLASRLRTGGFLVCDWPTGDHRERRDWIDVTTWEPTRRALVAASAGLELVSEGDQPNQIPSVWVKK